MNMLKHAAIMLGLMAIPAMAADQPVRAGDAELLPLPENVSILPELAQEPKGMITEPEPKDWINWAETAPENK